MDEQPKKTWQQVLRDMATTDPQSALELSLQETERARLKMQEASQVEIDASGRMIAKSLGALQQIGQFYANCGEILPAHFAGNASKCAVAHQWATRLGIDAIMLMQCSFVHKGKLGIEAKLLLGVLNSKGVIDGRIEYVVQREPSGEIISCQARARDKSSGQTLEGPIVTAEMVHAEGWDCDRGTQKSKWKTMPEVMYHWRAGAFFARLHYSDVVLGMQTKEELEDVAGVEPEGTTVLDLGLLKTKPVAPPTEIRVSKPQMPPEPPPVELPVQEETPEPEEDEPPFELTQQSEPVVQEEPPATVVVQPQTQAAPANSVSGDAQAVESYKDKIAKLTAGGVSKLLQKAEADARLSTGQVLQVRDAAKQRMAVLSGGTAA